MPARPHGRIVRIAYIGQTATTDSEHCWSGVIREPVTPVLVIGVVLAPVLASPFALVEQGIELPSVPP